MDVDRDNRLTILRMRENIIYTLTLTYETGTLAETVISDITESFTSSVSNN